MCGLAGCFRDFEIVKTHDPYCCCVQRNYPKDQDEQHITYEVHLVVNDHLLPLYHPMYRSTNVTISIRGALWISFMFCSHFRANAHWNVAAYAGALSVLELHLQKTTVHMKGDLPILHSLSNHSNQSSFWQLPALVNANLHSLWKASAETRRMFHSFSIPKSDVLSSTFFTAQHIPLYLPHRLWNRLTPSRPDIRLTFACAGLLLLLSAFHLLQRKVRVPCCRNKRMNYKFDVKVGQLPNSTGVSFETAEQGVHAFSSLCAENKLKRRGQLAGPVWCIVNVLER